MRIFLELTIVGITYDALFGMMPSLGIRGYAGTIFAILLSMILIYFKKVVRK